MIKSLSVIDTKRIEDIIVLKKYINYDRGDTAIKSKLKCRKVI